jgi:hypothetical protein
MCKETCKPTNILRLVEWGGGTPRTRSKLFLPSATVPPPPRRPARRAKAMRVAICQPTAQTGRRRCAVAVAFSRPARRVRKPPSQAAHAQMSGSNRARSTRHCSSSGINRQQIWQPANPDQTSAGRNGGTGADGAAAQQRNVQKCHGETTAPRRGTAHAVRATLHGVFTPTATATFFTQPPRVRPRPGLREGVRQRKYALPPLQPAKANN